MRIFISYASVQKEAAERVCSFLEAGGKRCWIAPRDIPAGSNYGEEILRGIENSDALVLVFDAAANESQHVLREVERAVSKKLPIVVLRLDDTEPSKAMEYFLLSIQWLDAKGMTERSFGELEKALERQLENKEETVMPEGINPHVKISLKKRLGILLAVMVILAVMIGLGTVQKKRNEERNGTPTSAVEQPEEEKTVFFTVGDYVSFGSYLPGGEAAKDGNGAIEWQVAEVGSQGTLLVATRILAIRPFDCAESGYFDRGSDGTVYDRSKKDTYTEEQMREFRGSNDWETSDLRVWLNTSGVVRYQGKAPQNAATDENGNAYGTEAGFLTDFTKEEALLIEQSGNGVFLLTKEQVEKCAKEGALNPSTTPTEAAIAADETNWYLSYKDAGATD
ncbi:MAG: toll/interleukin-1 receptor domain-containing protein, partial [Lachnospiraceae bacterium]|nr:toll/interleukin-1 receptor domain-containing protein [Lachnospiraceae bacterium]